MKCLSRRWPRLCVTPTRWCSKDFSLPSYHVQRPTKEQGSWMTVGSSVRGFKVGDRVMSGLLLNPCQQCENCKGPDDWHQYCTGVQGHIGTLIDGAFAEYHIADSRTSCLIPDHVTYREAAPLACAGRTIYRAIRTSGVQPGQWLALIGSGGGLCYLGIQFAIARGVNVLAMDVRKEALELCKEVGARHIIDTSDGHDSVVSRVRSITGGQGSDVTINLSSHPTSAELACAVTRMHETMIQTAGPAKVSIPTSDLMFRDIRVMGTLSAGRQCSLEMLAEYERNKLKVRINLFYGFEQVPNMLDAMLSGKMKGKAVCVVDRAAFERDLQQTKV